MRRAIRCLLAALAALPMTVVNAPVADAYWTSGCEFGGTISFNPPLGSLPTTGTYFLDGTIFCAGAAWGIAGVFPATDTRRMTVAGTYTGNCTEATLSDGNTIQFAVAGSVAPGYITVPWNGVSVAVLTPLVGMCPIQPLWVARINSMGAASSYLP